MIQPINGHILISPIKHEDFVEGGSSYDEVGEVLALPNEEWPFNLIKVGDKVYFDSYLVARYPSGDIDKPYWLVKFEDCRAIESNE